MFDTHVRLIDRIRSATSTAAWEQFVDLYKPLPISWARRLHLDEHDVADLVQEVFVALVDDEAGVTVLTAAKFFENAGEKNDQGRLTTALRDTLPLSPGAFFDPDGKIMNIRHLHTRVEDLVRNDSKGKQNPVSFAPWSLPTLVLRKTP